jgi:hypothetical protein
MRQASRQPKAYDFEVVLMLAAVVGAIADVVGTLIDVGQAAGWWL